MRTLIHHVALAVLLASGSLACEERPARPSPPATGGTPISLEIQGNTRLYRPGDTAQLSFMAVYEGGLKKDAMPLRPAFTFVGSPGVATITASGVLRATGYGRTTLQVSYGQRTASAAITVLPEGMFLLTGRVVQASVLAPISGGTVSVTTSGESFSAVTDGSGRYIVPAGGVVTLSVEALNFAPQSFPLTVSADMQFDVSLSRSNQAFGGAYILTYTASPSCSFPANIATRRYIAAVTDTPTEIKVLLSGAQFVASWSVPGFSGVRSGNGVSFLISSDDWFSDYFFVEDLGNNQVLSFDGTATGTITSASVLTTVFNGTVALGAPTGVIRCVAADHRFEFRNDSPASRRPR
jgi:hypothetical protein